MRIGTALLESWNLQQGHLFPWSAVCFAAGVGLYFQWPVEPGPWVWVGMCGFLGLGLGALIFASVRTVGWLLVLAVAGFGAGALRAHWVAAPVLEFRYYGSVEGRLIAVDRSQSDALRLTLDQVRLSRMSAERTPAKVRIALRELDRPPPIGAHVMTTAHLAPAGGPVEPGGFDFRRHLWFLGIGAVGYSRVPVLMSAPPGGELWVARFRAKITRALHDRLPGAGGAVAAAILTGDRSGLGAQTVEDLRASNLAHLLAISGLHMGLLTGVVFAAARMALVIVGMITGLRIRAKKSAAALALVAASLYLLISGGNVATERAFVMVAVIMVAVLLERRALTLRSVALAALIVLTHRPESLLSPGFQMSFAATTALVAVFGHLRHHNWNIGPRWARPLLILLMSSAVAGLATAPYGAAHFNTLSHYGLLANLLAVPVMGGLVMPAAVAAVVMLPFGAEGIALRAMVQGLEWILGVAQFVSHLPNPQSFVAQPSQSIVLVLTAGAIFVALWQGKGRLVGVAVVVLALCMWQRVERPWILIAEDGGLVGVMDGTHRVLSKAKGSGFPAKVWLENDGKPQSQPEAASDWAQANPGIIPIRGKRAAEAFLGCEGDWLVVSNQPLSDQGIAPHCLILDPTVLRQTGSVSIDQSGQITTSRSQTGLRLWSPSKWHGTVDPLAGQKIPVPEQ
ncbi:DUF4131 domain-containing protein [Epibacterium sp. SM1979]|uniref:DUF4131 domain-containing protein n=1 Tax=Tritonibacter litoralis TaxID=2662264 RepID=A0A843YAX2_9RHOB|nr:ComEC/Rec2 family competence protein [Tritonibacter litoralis]MQQ07028.1 DUF4131 domain-containing protein [Tritonibacter litoralis]